MYAIEAEQLTQGQRFRFTKAAASALLRFRAVRFYSTNLAAHSIEGPWGSFARSDSPGSRSGGWSCRTAPGAMRPDGCRSRPNLNR